MSRSVTAAALVIALVASEALLSQPTASDGVTEYMAEYDGYYKGRRVALAEFSVNALDDGGYEFLSSTRARGLLRIASPNPVIEHSQFQFEAGTVVPQRFAYEDGSRKGDENYVISFDHEADEIRVEGPDVSLQLPMEPTIHDRGGLQVALMRDLSACKAPGPYTSVDEDGITTYRYERLEDQILDSDIGKLDTVRFRQQSDGSSRSTVLALASEYGYLPVRMEQIRDGEMTSVLTLRSLEGIERSDSSCSGFR